MNRINIIINLLGRRDCKRKNVIFRITLILVLIANGSVIAGFTHTFATSAEGWTLTNGTQGSGNDLGYNSDGYVAFTYANPAEMTLTVSNPGIFTIWAWDRWNEDANWKVSFDGVDYGSEFTPPTGSYGQFSFTINRAGTHTLRLYMSEPGIDGNSRLTYFDDFVMTDFTPAAPTVTTTVVSAVTDNSANSGGDVTDDGGANVTAKGVCWNTGGSATLSDNHSTDGTGTGAFTSLLSGLSSGTTYYVRGYATNSAGTAYGSEVTFQTNHQPTFNNTIQFNGVNNHVVVGDHSSLFPKNAITVETWAKADAIERGTHNNILRSATDGYEIQERNDGYWKWYVCFEGLSWQYVRADDKKIVPGTWYHIAGTYDSSSGKQRIFINGVLKKEADRGGSLIYYNGKNFVIGAHANQSERYFDGCIDELRIWNTAKTAAEIRENMFKCLDGDEANLVAYYRFNQSSGSTLPDFTSNGFNGTLTNMTDDDWIDSDAFNTWLGGASSDWATAANWTDGAPISGANVGLYHWNDSNAPELSGNPTLNNIYIASDVTVTLSTGFTLNGNLFLNNDLDLNGQILTFGDNAELVETAGNILTNSSGNVSVTMVLNNITSVNVAGLGAEITCAANMGETSVVRGHSAQTGNGNQSIYRWYDITPTNNANLDATLVFHYDDSELNGISESNLVLFRSADGGDTWTQMGGAVDADANTITLSGISAFSRWTAGDEENALPVMLTSFTVNILDGSVVLEWNTVTETGLAGFELYRRSDEKSDWALIASYEDVPELCTQVGGVTGNMYLYIDKTANPGAHRHYLLVGIEMSGRRMFETQAELTIDVACTEEILPTKHELYPAYPNPFNPSTTIEYFVPERSQVRLSVYNLLGEKIRILVAGIQNPGKQTATWDGRDAEGKLVGSGVYVYKFEVGSVQLSRKMMFLR